jgi:Putative metal-binding motif
MNRLNASLLVAVLVSMAACGGNGSVSGDGGAPDPDGVAGDDAVVSLPDSGICIDMDRDGFCRGDDCDEQNPAVNRGEAEVCGNAMDDNCDGQVDEGCLAGTTGYFVDTDSLGGTCDDGNPGTLTAPWCTLAQANAMLVAGDTVYLRAGTYSGETIQPANAGTSNTGRITYSAYNDEEATLTGSVYCIRLQSTSYITILGLRLYDCERNLYIQASSHNNVGYCEIDTPMGPTTWAGSRIYEGSQYNRIYNSIFSRYGAEAYYDGGYQDSGVNLDIGNDNDVDASDHNLVINNTFSYGGHHILGVYANYNVIRGNTFHNEEWYDCNRTSIGGQCGNRNVILNASQPDNNIRNVIEDNWIVFSGVPPDQDASAGLGIRTQYNIVRRNIFYHNDSSGVSLSTNGGNHNDASNNYVYHNVLYKNGTLLLDDWDPRKTGMMLARWVDSAEYNAITSVAIKNNIFHDNQLHAIYFYYVDELEQDVAANWLHEGAPEFAAVSGTPDPSDFEVYDFRLQPTSPCIDNGGFLTQTTNTGQDSTRVEVSNAGYFTDGHGIVEGDLIMLEGQFIPAVVLAIDYATNTLTVDTPLTWDANTGVALGYHGDAPDQGAFEHAFIF